MLQGTAVIQVSNPPSLPEVFNKLGFYRCPGQYNAHPHQGCSGTGVEEATYSGESLGDMARDDKRGDNGVGHEEIETKTNCEQEEEPKKGEKVANLAPIGAAEGIRWSESVVTIYFFFIGVTTVTLGM